MVKIIQDETEIKAEDIALSDGLLKTIAEIIDN